jgi:hypothetical protein
MLSRFHRDRPDRRNLMHLRDSRPSLRSYRLVHGSEIVRLSRMLL